MLWEASVLDPIEVCVFELDCKFHYDTFLSGYPLPWSEHS